MKEVREKEKEREVSRRGKKEGRSEFRGNLDLREDDKGGKGEVKEKGEGRQGVEGG